MAAVAPLVVLVRAAGARAADAEPGEDNRQHAGEHQVDPDQARLGKPVVPLAVHGLPPHARNPTLATAPFSIAAATDCEQLHAFSGTTRAHG